MSNPRSWGRLAGEVVRWVVAIAGAGALLVVLGDFQTPEPVAAPLREHSAVRSSERVWSMDFGADRWLAAAMLTGEVWMRDLVSGETRSLVDGSISLARCVAFSPDAGLLAVAGGHSKVRIWEVGSGEEREPLESEENEVQHVAFSPDGSRLAVGGGRGYLAIWDVATRRPLHALVGHCAKINALAISSDGKLLATGDTHGVLKLWNTSEPSPPVTMAGRFVKSGGINSIAFSPDGAWLAASDLAHGWVRLYDGRSAMLRHELHACSQGVNVIRFSPGGDTLAMACVDGMVRRWSLETHAWLPEIWGGTVGLHALDFRSEGRCLAAGAADGAVRFWDMTP